MKNLLIYTLFVMFVLLTGCSTDKIPGVYRIDIQQGNNVSQEMLNKLKPGMTKNQVVYVMGTPLVVDTFHPNRWDYIYSFQPGNGEREQRRITLYFDKDEKLSHIEGDTKTVARSDLPTAEQKDTNVVVPLTEKKTGLFQSLLNSIGLGEDEAEIVDDTSKTQSSDDQATTSGKEPAADSDSQDNKADSP